MHSGGPAGKSKPGGAERVVAFYQENGPQFQLQHYLLEKEAFFGADGYLSLLVGMGVPCKTSFVSSAGVCAMGQDSAAVCVLADRAFEYEEAMRLFTSPGWVWPEGWHGRTY